MRITSSGVIYCFQFFIFFNVLVEGLVLLTLAATIAKFFAYNCLGERSTVLRNKCFEGTAECLTVFNELTDLGRASREQTETQAASKRQRFASRFSGVADKMLRQQGGTSGARAAPRPRSLTMRSMRSAIESMRSDTESMRSGTTVVATFAAVAAAAEAAAAEPAAEPAAVAATSVSASALSAASVRVRVAVLCE